MLIKIVWHLIGGGSKDTTQKVVRMNATENLGDSPNQRYKILWVQYAHIFFWVMNNMTILV